jgi:hypothetical protein
MIRADPRPRWIAPLKGRGSYRNPYEATNMNHYIQPNVDPNQPIVNWLRLGGGRIAFNRYDIGAIFYPVGGLYIFCKSIANGFDAIYVGESDNLWRRITNELATHHAWPCARSRGVTHICALRVDDEATRLALETELRHSLNPPCNLQ